MAKDLIDQVTDSLSHHPISYGAMPAFGGVGLSFIEELEIGLRLVGLLIGLSIGVVTLYIKLKEIKSIAAAEKAKIKDEFPQKK